MVEVADTPERVKPLLCRACEWQFSFEWVDLYAYHYTCPCGKVYGWVGVYPAYMKIVEDNPEGQIVIVRREKRKGGKRGTEPMAH